MLYNPAEFLDNEKLNFELNAWPGRTRHRLSIRSFQQFEIFFQNQNLEISDVLVEKQIYFRFEMKILGDDYILPSSTFSYLSSSLVDLVRRRDTRRIFNLKAINTKNIVQMECPPNDEPSGTNKVAV